MIIHKKQRLIFIEIIFETRRAFWMVVAALFMG